jgi:hypothetical protein
MTPRLIDTPDATLTFRRSHCRRRRIRTVTKRYRDRIMETIHKTVESLHAAGLIDERAAHKFDDAFLTPSRVPRSAGRDSDSR